jgi:hypothetical protein
MSTFILPDGPDEDDRYLVLSDSAVMNAKWEWGFADRDDAYTYALHLWEQERGRRLAVYLLEDMDWAKEDPEVSEGTVEFWRVDEAGMHLLEGFAPLTLKPQLGPTPWAPPIRGRLSPLAARMTA